MLKHLKEITGDETLTVHGFRTAFRIWAQEETDFEEEIVEHCQHPITGDDAEKGLQARRGSKEAACRDAGIRQLRDAATEKQPDADEGRLRVRTVHPAGRGISPLIGQIFQEGRQIAARNDHCPGPPQALQCKRPSLIAL